MEVYEYRLVIFESILLHNVTIDTKFPSIPSIILRFQLILLGCVQDEIISLTKIEDLSRWLGQMPLGT